MSYMSIFSFFLPYLQDHGLLRSRNFARKAKRRKQLFLSTSSKTTQMSTSAWGMPLLQYLPPTILNQNHPHRSQLNPVLNHTLASVVFLCTWLQVIVPSVQQEQQLECNALLELAVGQGPVFIYNMLFFIRTYLIQILILESHQNLKCHQWIWHELEWQQVFP